MSGTNSNVYSVRANMKKTPKSPKASSVLRKQRKKKSNPIIPIAIGFSMLLIILIGITANSGKPAVTQTETDVAAVSNETSIEKPVLEKVKADKSSVKQKPETKTVDNETIEVVSYNKHTEHPEKVAESDLQSLQALKLEVRQLTIERKWDDAVSFINNYNGPHKSDLIGMLEGIETAKLELEKFESNAIARAESNKVSEEVETTSSKDSNPVEEQATVENKPKKLQPLLKTKEEGRGPNGFLFETDLDRRQAKRGGSVSLVVHSKEVGLPQSVIVVWKDRNLVLSYSRLIKKLENRASRYYKERVENAKEFLAENKERYTLVPYAKAKLSLRRVGFTVSEVFFNETVVDDYNKRTTDRYKGFIISYDLKQTAASVSIGC